MKVRRLKHRYDVPRRYESKRGLKRWIAWKGGKSYFNRWWGYNPCRNRHFRLRRAAQVEAQWHS